MCLPRPGCWGFNSTGQLGDGTSTTRPTPATKDVLTGVQAIAAGGAHTCALTTTGGVRCWGDDFEGQLGDRHTGTSSAKPLPAVITGVKAITAGARHTCALTTDGGVRCWGSNSAGQLGNGFRPTPAPVLCQ